MKSYPIEHKEIVSHLLDGRFIIYPNPLFTALQKQDDDYKEFFKLSYGFELNFDSEFAYLSGADVNEKKTRDFTLFLAIFCRELDYSGKNFKEAVELGTFNIEETDQLLKQSSKWEIVEKTTIADFESFVNTWHRRNVLSRAGNQFKFTKAVKLFFEFAVNVASAKFKEQQIIKTEL